MTEVKRLDNVRNTTVLATVFMNELIHTVYDRLLHFPGHMLRGTYSPHTRTYALYQPTYGSTRRGRPRTNYMDYIQKLTGLKLTNSWRHLKIERPGVNLWSHMLIHNHPTRERERESQTGLINTKPQFKFKHALKTFSFDLCTLLPWPYYLKQPHLRLTL